MLRKEPEKEEYGRRPDADLLDRVTGLPNYVRLEADIAEGRAGKWLLVLDVGGLRNIGAIYGRKNGDALLALVRDYILEMKIPDSVLYRTEVGDFGLLLQDPGVDADGARRVAQSLLDRFENEWEMNIDGWSQTVAISAEACVVPLGDMNGLPFAAVCGAIDNALSEARGLGGVVFCGEYDEENYQYKTALEQSLKNAVNHDMAGFYPAYQPIVESGVAMWSGVEVLCRWDSPDFGPVPPLEFIPIAESHGLIGKIGLWLLERAIRRIKLWKLDQTEDFLLNINLSPFQLKSPHLDRDITELLKRYEYPPEKLCLEVTESGSMIFQPQDVQAIKRLSDIGVVIALDDFGSGFASLNVLHELPVRMLKIDKELLDGMESNERLRHLFRAIVGLAHNSNIKVVAEGVETAAQARLLLEHNTDYFQGYLFSRPLSAEQMEQKLHHFKAPSERFVSMEYDRFDVLKPAFGHSYQLSPSLYRTLYECARELFLQDDCDSAIGLALRYVGQSMGVSRAYVFLKDSGETFSNTHEWCAPGITPEKQNLQRLPMAAYYPSWIRALEKDGVLLAADVRTLEPAVAEVLQAQNIKALVEFPLWRDTEMYGFVGFDDCAGARKWAPEEVQALHTLTGIIASALAKVWLQKQVAEESAKREIILDSLDTAIHVTDLKTREILFANDGLLRMYGNKDIVGRKCWQVLENREKACDFCPIEELVKTPGKMLQWDHYRENVKRYLKIRGVVIPWTQGMLAYMEHAEDVTELRDSQNKLRFLASTDMLTLTMNRPFFIEAAMELLASAEKDGVAVTLAFVDIDGLKYVNDTYGHSEGDELIMCVVNALRHSTREGDLLCRFGGDEFVLLIHGCGKENAVKTMRRTQRRLKTVSAKKQFNCGFSYGCAENSEVEFTTPTEHVEKLLALADERMFEQKRRMKEEKLNR